MKRLYLVLFPIFVFASPRVAAADATAKPNIVLFVTDDQSPIAGCYGSPLIQTPNLDQLAKEGLLFSHAYATTASCSASRSVILTGLQNHANGQYGHTDDYHKFSSFPSCASLSLPLQMKANGYRTAHIGKLHIAPESVFHFDQYLEAKNAHNTSEWIESCLPLFTENSDAPFFLCFWTKDLHRSEDTEPSAEGKLKPNRFGNPPAGKNYPGTEEVIYDPAKILVPVFLPDSPECRQELAQYYQSVTRTDKALGALMESLKKSGKWDNTIVIFTADHGMAFPGAKTTVYEAGLHVPLVIRDPRAKLKGTSSDALVSHTDLTPTILDLAGGYDTEKQAPKKLLPVPEIGQGENPGKPMTKYHGRSWAALLNENQTQGWDEIASSHTFHEVQMYYPMRAVRDRKFKLIWNIAYQLPYPFASDLWAASTWQAQFQKGPQAPYGQRTVNSYIHRPHFELYDISSDPNETRNLAEDPAHIKTLELYQEKIKTMQRDTDDPWIMKWQYD